jgi:hypothetical protein
LAAAVIARAVLRLVPSLRIVSVSKEVLADRDLKPELPIVVDLPSSLQFERYFNDLSCAAS